MDETFFTTNWSLLSSVSSLLTNSITSTMSTRQVKRTEIAIEGYIRELRDAINHSLKIPSDLRETVLLYYLVSWIKMRDTPIRVMFNSVTINNVVYLFPDYMTRTTPYLNNFCNRKYVNLDAYSGAFFKYDAVHDKFAVIGKYPSDLTSIAKTVSYDPRSRNVTVIGGTHDIFGTLPINNVDPKSLVWDLSRNFQGAYEVMNVLPFTVYCYVLYIHTVYPLYIHNANTSPSEC